MERKYVAFVHAILACTSTSTVYGLRKGIALKKACDEYFRQLADVFNRPNVTKDGIVVAGGIPLFDCATGNEGNKTLYTASDSVRK